MTHPLDVSFSIPLEREYEAWIIHGIESYFRSQGERLQVWAISPIEEAIWPADESLMIGKKLIGLQMKRVEYVRTKYSGLRDFGRLRWSFYSPTTQFQLVLNTPEIYYCLPTFLNRDIKEQALDHCLFWRPDSHGPRGKVAWYDNTRSTTPYCSIGSSSRWGKFLEDILTCSVGRRVDSIHEAKMFIRGLQAAMREIFVGEEEREIFVGEEERDNSYYQMQKTSVYVLAIPVRFT